MWEAEAVEIIENSVKCLEAAGFAGEAAKLREALEEIQAALGSERED